MVMARPTISNYAQMWRRGEWLAANTWSAVPTLILYKMIQVYVSDDQFAALPADARLSYLPEETREDWLNSETNNYRNDFPLSGQHIAENIDILSALLFKFHDPLAARLVALARSEVFGPALTPLNRASSIRRKRFSRICVRPGREPLQDPGIPKGGNKLDSIATRAVIFGQSPRPAGVPADSAVGLAPGGVFQWVRLSPLCGLNGRSDTVMLAWPPQSQSRCNTRGNGM